MFKHTCTLDLSSALSIPSLLPGTSFSCMPASVYVRRIRVRADSVCVLKATVMCLEAGRRGGGHSLQQRTSFDPSISSSHLSVYKIHREQRDRPRWHTNRIYGKARDDMQNDRKAARLRMHQIGKQVGKQTESVLTATGTCSFAS